MSLTIPNIIEDDTEIVAIDHRQNYEAIEDHINTDVIDRDGSVAMVGELLLAASPTATLGAATKGYVDGALATMTIFTRTTDTAVAMSPATYDIVWEGEQYDPDGWGTVGSATLTCPTAGLYLITARTDAAATGDGIVGTVDLDPSGTGSYRFHYDTQSHLGGAASAFGIYLLAAGNTVVARFSSGVDSPQSLLTANIAIARLQ